MKEETEILDLFNFLDLIEQESNLNKLLQEYEMQMPVVEKAKEEALLIEERKPCPHYQSKNITKRGSQNNMKMYCCKDCKKWYSQSTGTPLWDIKLKQNRTAAAVVSLSSLYERRPFFAKISTRSMDLFTNEFRLATQNISIFK